MKRPDEEAVVLATVRQPGGADGGPGGWPVFVLEEVEKSPVGGDRTLPHRCGAGGAQPRPIRRGNPRREPLERGEEGAFLGVFDNMARNRDLIAVEHDAGHGHSELDAAPHQGDVLVEIPRDVPEQRDIRLVVGDGSQRRLVRKPGHPDVETRIGVDRDEVRAESGVADPLRERRFEDIAVDTVLFRKTLARNLEEPVPEIPQRCRAPLHIGLGHRAEARGRRTGERRGEAGLFSAAELHEPVEERMKGRVVPHSRRLNPLRRDRGPRSGSNPLLPEGEDEQQQTDRPQIHGRRGGLPFPPRRLRARAPLVARRARRAAPHGQPGQHSSDPQKGSSRRRVSAGKQGRICFAIPRLLP